MIFEVATINVLEGQQAAFERGVAEALPIFRRAKGFKSLELERSIEEPLRYRLVVGWDSLHDHVIAFRGSEDFQAWRSLVAHAFADAPSVEHTEVILTDNDEAYSAR